MRELLIQIEETEWQQIQEMARRLNCSVEEVARRAISRLVLHTPPPSEEWKQQMERILTSVHQRTVGYDPKEIEADITAAFEEHRKSAGRD